MGTEEQADTMTGEVKTGNELVLAGGSSVSDLKARMARMSEIIKLKAEFLRDHLTEGIHNDYAVIPGTKERSLLKPGAEKLLDWHGYYATFTLMADKEDYDLGLFACTYRCDIKQKGSNMMMAQCEGDCSTFESKYRFEWRTLDKVPPSLNPDSLLKKNYGSEDNPWWKYQLVVDNPADKRNTVRKMAQKRALIGATVLATATSDLFTTKDPDDDDAGAGAVSGSDPTGEAKTYDPGTKKDYGKPISDAQGKRLYAIRKKHNIDDLEFKAWIRAKYGLTSDKEIGWKAYEEICKACESGHLEMPKAAEAKAESTAQPKTKETAAPGATIGVSHIKEIGRAHV